MNRQDKQVTITVSPYMWLIVSHAVAFVAGALVFAFLARV